MTNPPPGKQVHNYAKSAKDKVRKSGTSAERKIFQLGEKSQVFSTVVYFNPTYERLEGAVYVPEGQYVPDVNGFLIELLKDSCDKGPGHGPRRAQTYRQLSQNAQTSRATVRVESDMGAASTEVGAAAEERAHANTVASQSHGDNVGINGAGCAGEATIGHDGTPHAVRHGEMTAEDWSQVDRRMRCPTVLSLMAPVGRLRRLACLASGRVASPEGWRPDTRWRTSGPETSLSGRRWMRKTREFRQQE
ncbi:hypothetical protein K456DRAFT_1421164 [Colletotrichum gloeosporioides 23]|nr:hypothetical protein K456DRAFT_1421164 [Colletotrichum gloeosporioides 23]